MDSDLWTEQTIYASLGSDDLRRCFTEAMDGALTEAAKKHVFATWLDIARASDTSTALSS